MNNKFLQLLLMPTAAIVLNFFIIFNRLYLKHLHIVIRSLLAVKSSYNDAKELKELPVKIEKLEAQIAALHAKMADPNFYSNSDEVIKTNAQVEKMESELEKVYNRWQELEEFAQE